MVRSKETPASDNKGGYDEEFEEEWAGMSILTIHWAHPNHTGAHI